MASMGNQDEFFKELFQVMGEGGSGSGRIPLSTVSGFLGGGNDPSLPKWTYKILLRTSVFDYEGDEFEFIPWEAYIDSKKDELNMTNVLAMFGQRLSNILRSEGTVGGTVEGPDGEPIYCTFLSGAISRVQFRGELLGREPFDLAKTKAREADDGAY